MMLAAVNRPSTMWRIASSLFGKSHLRAVVNVDALHTSSSSSSSLNLNPSSPNSSLLKLTRADVEKLLSDRYRTGFHHINDAHDLFCRMVEFRPLPSVSEFNRLLTGVVKMKEFRSGVLLYREMCFEGVPIDVMTMNIVINCFCHLKQVDFAFAVLGTSFKRGFTPNLVTLNTFTRGLCDLYRWNDLKRLMTELVLGDTRIYPDVVTFSTLLDVCNRVECVQEAEVMLKIMIAKGERPNVITYSSLIDRYCRQGDMDRAYQVLRIMVAHGCQPNIHSYSILLKGFCRSGNVDDAVDLLKVILNSSMRCNVVTFNTMIQGLFGVGRCDEAQKLISAMQSQGVSPDNITYCIWLDGLYQNGLVSEANELLRDLENRNVSLDIVTYNAVIKGLFKNGDPSSAKNVFERLSSLGLKPNIRTFNTMMTGLCQEELLEDAEELLAKMKECDCYPNNITYNAVVQCFLKRSEGVEAKLVLEEMLSHGIEPDSHTCSLLGNSTLPPKQIT